MPAYLNCDWELVIQYNPKELGEPYELYFFLGPVPPSVGAWRDSPLRIFEPITSQAHHTTTEFRDLNGYLEHHYGDNLKDDDVISNLRKDLSWAVKKLYLNEKVENSKLGSLKVSVNGPDGTITLSDKTSCQ